MPLDFCPQPHSLSLWAPFPTFLVLLRLPFGPASPRPSAQALLLGPRDWSLPLPPTQGGGSDDTELRYSSQYEERLDPFSSFSKRVCEPGLRARLGRDVRRSHPRPWPQPPLTPHSASPDPFRQAQAPAALPPPADHQGSLRAHGGAMKA